MSDIIPTVGILIIKDNKVLLVKHGEKASHLTGSYSLPAGRVENGETEKQAAVRELQEETGLHTTENDLIEVPLSIPPADIKRKNGEIKRFSLKVFHCKKYTGELTSSDETTPEWVPIDDLDKYTLIVNTKKIIEEARIYFMI